MKIRFFIVLFGLVGTFWGQIDTRISPAPAPAEQTHSDASSKWTGDRLTGFLSEELGSTLKQGMEATFAVSGAETNQLPSYNYDELSRITGTLSLHRDWSRASLLTQYVGGTDIYVKNSYLNTQYHLLSAAQAFKWSRWNFSLNQSFSYLPQSSFGFAPSLSIGNGLTSSTSNGTPGEPALFLPANIIQRQISAQTSAEYVMGARSSLTFSGSFSDLHFSGVTPGTTLVDSQVLGPGAQYTYKLNASSAIGAGYQFVQGRSLGFNSVLYSHSATGTFSHKLGKRFALRVSAGPQFTTLNQFGMETSLGTSATVTASADYQLERTTLGVSYFRGVNPGSGLFLGSRVNDVRASVDRQLTRTLRAAISAGYGQNDNIGAASINAAQRINSTYVAATLERTFGRMFSGFLTYSMQNQDTNALLCNSSGCTTFPMTHIGTIGLRFYIHPLTFRQ